MTEEQFSVWERHDSAGVYLNFEYTQVFVQDDYYEFQTTAAAEMQESRF